MQQRLGFIHAHAYNILSMPELVWKFNTFKLRWFPCLRCLHHSMCGPMKDNHVTIPQAAPYYRLFACVHTIAQLVWGFRYLDTSHILIKGALSKSPPFAGTMSPKWASHGEKDEGFIPALQEKLTAAARMPSTARRVSRVVG